MSGERSGGDGPGVDGPTASSRRAPRKRPAQERSRVTVDAICVAAGRVLKEGGDVSTRRIAEVAGVSVGTLYQYFQNRETLVTELVRRQLDAMGAAMAEALARSDGQSLAERVRAIVQGVAGVKATDPGLHRALAAWLFGIEATPMVATFKDVTTGFIQALLEHHRAEVEAPALDVAARVVVDAVDGALFAEVVRGGARLGDPAFVDEVACLAIRYLCGSRAAGQ
jgi:AcrR family transcriptional regulator